MDDTDIRYMTLALSLAGKGRGTTSPNPMVGAIIVRDNEIVGQGYHRKAGEEHAEVLALREAGDAARGATLYVTLEPCCHYGKTPPCTDIIIRNGIRRVVAAMLDDNPRVCGEGCDRLQQSGIDVVVGVLENRARKLNEAYLKYITRGVPFVTLKLASTLDGRIADPAGKSKWITGPETRKRVHQMRAWSDAVLVGVGTVLADDPALNVRDAEGADPLRVVADSSLRTPPDARVFADGNVVIATTREAEERKRAMLEDRGVDILTVDSENGRVSLSTLLAKLAEQEVMSVLCEGGGTIAASLLRGRLADKIIFTIAPKILGVGLPAIADFGVGSLDAALNLGSCAVETVGDDIIVTGYPEYD